MLPPGRRKMKEPPRGGQENEKSSTPGSVSRNDLGEKLEKTSGLTTEL